MSRTVVRARTRAAPARRLLAAVLAAVIVAAAAPVWAQGWWPWGGEQERGPPVPREPVYREPGEYDQQEPPGAPPPAGSYSSSRNSLCLQLEQRLVQETKRGSESRNIVPMVENELRQVEDAYRRGQNQLERMNCYDYFLFSKTLRKTRRCIDLANQVDADKRRLDDLEVQRQQLMASSGRSYQDEIVRELARNNCGAAYQQQARKQNNFNPFSAFWEDEESSSGGGFGYDYGNLPFATYRTVCVRLCDGYYFPISFSTLPNHFQRDAEECQSKCAAPAELYYYQNPGGSVEQMVAARTNEQYMALKTAFRYRKEFVRGCSCKVAEYVPEGGAPQRQGEAGTDGSTEQRAEAPPGELPWRPR